jgi:hypothetical protein
MEGSRKIERHGFKTKVEMLNKIGQQYNTETSKISSINTSKK